MPSWQKRKHLKDDEVSAGSYEAERNTKCSLSSLCYPEDRDVRPSSPPDPPDQVRVLVDVTPSLRGAIVYCNMLGAGVKGPVLEINAKFFNYDVTYCTERDHQRMTNRDVAAAKKIGARYLAMKKGLNLGPWSRSVSAEEVKQGTHASKVLTDVLTSYARGEYFQRRSRRLLQRRADVL